MRRTTRREFVRAGVIGAVAAGIGGGAAAEEFVAGAGESTKNWAANNGAAGGARASAEAAAGQTAGKLAIKKGLVYDMLPG
ncbi:MAG: hypothetical protein WA829_08085, partial [Candidatus Acidiferrum sp.]